MRTFSVRLVGAQEDVMVQGDDAWTDPVSPGQLLIGSVTTGQVEARFANGSWIYVRIERGGQVRLDQKIDPSDLPGWIPAEC